MGNQFPVFDGGVITVELLEKNHTFNTGMFVNGRVLVNQQKPFAASSLKLQLVGTEHTEVSVGSGKSQRMDHSSVMI